ncbi:S-adenosyl-L-methionine-dependent methyltransferase [Phaeosphaeriaceae sp. SRC1lsM3a]|nr:S-adenosyl-L-methionine-dependent methyltransferase [Stagonospora sp. SRC1lsM3a]
MPKQAKALLAGSGKVDVYNATGAPVTAQFATHNLSLIPSFPSGSIIHDNACGDGTVSRIILSSSPTPTDVQIHATDIDQVFLDALSASVTQHSWPVDVSNQNLNSLSFPDNHFTHSITNIGIIFASSAGLDGAKEIHRTLKPGGTAIVNCWQHITWLPPFMRTVMATRPGPPSSPPPISWADGTQLQKIMKEAGFEESKMRVETSEAWAKTSDLRAWAEKAWAFLGGIPGGWKEDDEERWEEAVDVFVAGLEAAEGTKRVDGETWMRATQWVVIAVKAR